MTDVLAHARAARYEVGTNLKGRGIGAAWTLLLPTLEIESVAVIGRITPDELAAIDGLGATRVDLGRTDPAAMLGAEQLDLVVIGRGGAEMLRRSSNRLTGHLSPEGAIYGEVREGSHGVVDTPDASIRRFDLWPARGPARVFVPADDPNTAGRLKRLGFLPARGSGRLTSRLLDGLGRLPIGSGRRTRQAEMALGRSGASAGPPAYVVAIARAAGIDIGSAPWALVAPGDYASQKVLLLLFDPVDGEPGTIVKLGADPAHADRLRNEAAALKHLAGLGLPNDTFPELHFAGEHAGRGVVAQGWMNGRPFPDASGMGADSSELASAATSLTTLASLSVERRASAEVGAALRDLFVRFRAIHGLSEHELSFLEDQVRAVESHSGTLPVVFQHGDPGVWNLLVGDEGTIAFLDWESADRYGLPLWDLVHLQWSFGSLASRRSGERRRIVASLRHLATPTELAARFADQISNLAGTVALPRTLIRPLFYTAWMHRSLKEATRRTPATLERGLYLRILRELIRRREDPALRRLLSLDP